MNHLSCTTLQHVAHGSVHPVNALEVPSVAQQAHAIRALPDTDGRMLLGELAQDFDYRRIIRRLLPILRSTAREASIVAALPLRMPMLGDQGLHGLVLLVRRPTSFTPPALRHHAPCLGRHTCASAGCSPPGALELAGVHTDILGLPLVERGVADAVLPKDVGHLGASLMLLEYRDDLLLGELAFSHGYDLLKVAPDRSAGFPQSLKGPGKTA